MKKIMLIGSFILLAVVGGRSSWAGDFNLINVSLTPSEQKQASQFYGQAYGFSPQQVNPLFSGPVGEVPTILRIAQAAGTIPTTVLRMRQAGFSYGSILSNLALAPAMLWGSGLGTAVPSPGASTSWLRLMDPLYVQASRTYLLQNILKVNPKLIPSIPYEGASFTRSLLRPYNAKHGLWLPPGIAKKYGLWVPPGQLKKWNHGYGHPFYSSKKVGKKSHHHHEHSFKAKKSHKHYHKGPKHAGKGKGKGKWK